MLNWRLATTFPEQHIWVLAYRSKQPNVVRYEPYAVVYRSGNQWMNTSGYTVDHITHWAYINPPLAATPPATDAPKP